MVASSQTRFSGASQDGGDAFQEEQPFPSLQSEHAVEFEQAGRDRRAEGARCRDRQHQRGIDPGAIGARKPVGQIQQHAREQPGLGSAQKEARQEKAALSGYQGHATRGDPPGDSDAADPAAGADSLQDEIAGHFARNVAEEERGHAQGVSVGRETEILVHGQRGKPEVDPVDEAQQVEQEDQRQQPPGDSSYRHALDVFGHGCLPFVRRSCCWDVWSAAGAGGPGHRGVVAGGFAFSRGKCGPRCGRSRHWTQVKGKSVKVGALMSCIPPRQTFPCWSCRQMPQLAEDRNGRL
jgi:hypothetical protein